MRAVLIAVAKSSALIFRSRAAMQLEILESRIGKTTPMLVSAAPVTKMSPIQRELAYG